MKKEHRQAYEEGGKMGGRFLSGLLSRPRRAGRGRDDGEIKHIKRGSQSDSEIGEAGLGGRRDLLARKKSARRANQGGGQTPRLPQTPPPPDTLCSPPGEKR